MFVNWAQKKGGVLSPPFFVSNPRITAGLGSAFEL